MERSWSTEQKKCLIILGFILLGGGWLTISWIAGANRYEKPYRLTAGQHILTYEEIAPVVSGEVQPLSVPEAGD